MTLITSESFYGFDLHYDDLTNRLNKVKKEFGLKRAVSTRSLTGETRTFAELLDQEVETVVLYFLEVQGILAQKVRQLRSKQIEALQGCEININGIEEFLQKYRNVSSEVIELLKYLDRNTVWLGEILSKHDKLFDQKMTSNYFSTRYNGDTRNSQLAQLYHQEGIRAIVGAIRTGFEELYEARKTLLGMQYNESPEKILRSQSSDGLKGKSGQKTIPRVPYLKKLASSSNLQKLIDNDAPDNQPDPRALILKTRSDSIGSILESGAANISTRPRSLSEMEPILKIINDVADQISKTQKKTTVEYIATQSDMGLEFSLRDMIQAPLEGLDGKTKRTSTIGLYLNHLLTFIYLANQYVVAPTSARYADMLGMTPAMSGLIIGFTPAAALLSSLVYSTLSNRSFKIPLLISIVFGILGNLAYGAALQYNSIELIFLGRVLTGFGGARVISRRYIADHVSLEDRLVASTQFVTAGAMGLAAGPLIASLIERYNASFVIHGFDGKSILLLYENVTAPGWIMCLLWTISFFAVLIYFQEPELQTSLNDSAGTSGKETIPLKHKFDSYNSFQNQNVVYVESGNELWTDEPSIELSQAPSNSFGKNSRDIRFENSYNENQPFLNYTRGNSFQKILEHTNSFRERALTCLGFVSKEVYVIIFMYIVNKAGQEMAVSSMPLVIRQAFHWEDESVGYYMATIGSLVLPFNIFINNMTKSAEEREILLRLSTLSLIGIFISIHIGIFGNYTLFQYVCGTALVFTSLNSLEGIIMSLLSKLISPELAKGTFNSGLLATEAGTFGRVLGDFAIAALGQSISGYELINRLFFPLSIAIILTMYLIHLYYDSLIE